jgi:hypothetical protein
MYLILLKSISIQVYLGALKRPPPHFQQQTMLYCDLCVILQLSRHNHDSAYFRAIVDLYEKESDICTFIRTIKVTCSDLKFDTEE